MKSTLEVVIGALFTVPEIRRRSRPAKFAHRLDYVVVIAHDAIRVYRFGKHPNRSRSGLGIWNNSAPWVHARTRRAVVEQLREMGFAGEVPALPLTATNPKDPT